jgi:hypothetical protein
MKTKIRAISLMTLGVLILSFFVIRTVLQVMTEDAKNPYKVYQGTATPTYNTNAYVMKMPAHKSGSIAVNHHRQSGRSVARQSTPNVYVPLKSVEQGISSGFSLPATNNAIYSRRSKKSADDNSMNNQTLTVMPVRITKPSGTMNLVTTGKDVESDLIASNMSAPFSEGNTSGPMRMDKDDENPPPEGVPVGNGVWAMFFLAAAYTLYRKKFSKE